VHLYAIGGNEPDGACTVNVYSHSTAVNRYTAGGGFESEMRGRDTFVPTYERESLGGTERDEPGG